MTSICLQAICNSNRKFLDIFVGYPGSVHDNRVFENSDIHKKLSTACGNYIILADSAYRCSKYVITPYRDNGRLTRQQKLFNRSHSSARVCVEHSFGVLKQRFRQLYYCKLRGIDKICHFIRACVVLHNMIDNEDFIEQSEMPNAEVEDEDISLTDADIQSGSIFRDQLCDDLFGNS